MELFFCKECKGNRFRKIGTSEYECEYCGAIFKEDVNTARVDESLIQQANRLLTPAAPFAPKISYAANYKDGSVWLGGTLFVHPDIFVFKPHSFNFGCNKLQLQWRIIDIDGYAKGFLTYLDIKMRDRTVVKLTVNMKDSLIRVLEARRQFFLNNR